MQRITSLFDYFKKYEQSVKDPEEFWAEIADTFIWKKKWDKVLDWDFDSVDIKWFQNAKLNITENILEKNLKDRGDKTAIIWEPNDPNEPSIRLTYKELYEETCKFSNALREKGIKKGDRVIIYMPMVPEAAIAMLACARVGAVHSVVFAGFSSTSLADRINDCQAKMVLTSDGNFRGNKTIPVKPVVDEALEKCKTIESVIVLERTKQKINMTSGRDFWWHDCICDVSSQCDPEIWQLGIPVLGVCYGMQLMVKQLGGQVEKATRGEYGKASLCIDEPTHLLTNVEDGSTMWMSHGDSCTRLPEGFSILAHTENTVCAAIANHEKKLFGVQFHPEVVHSVDGIALIRNFVYHICECEPTWTTEAFVDETIREIRAKVGDKRVLLALSGGVDSSTLAFLLHQAIGEKLTCMIIDQGFMRKGEPERLKDIFDPRARSLFK